MIDIIAMYNSLIAERNNRLSQSNLLDQYLLSINDIATSTGNTYGTSKEASQFASSRKRPHDAGARALKGLASTLISTLSPSNVRWHRLAPGGRVDLTPEQSMQIDKLYRGEENRFHEFLMANNFQRFAYACIERNLWEGATGVKVDLTQGFRLYPLRALACQRNWGKIQQIIFEETVYVEDKETGKQKPASQYIYVDKAKNEVWVQPADSKKANRITGEYASQYFIVTGTDDYNSNYSRAYYWDHYRLLVDINDAADDLAEARKNCAWNWLMLTTSDSRITTDDIARIKSREVIRLPEANAVTPFSFGVKISDWAFVAQSLQQSIQDLLNLSAVGLQQRASQIQTATEVNAIMAELNAQIGSLAQNYAQSLFQQTLLALMDIFQTRESLQRGLAEAGLEASKEVIDNLIRPIVVTGAPATAREADAEKLFRVTQNAVQTFGLETTAQVINIRAVMKEVFDGLRINTETVFQPEQPAADPQQVLEATTAAEAEQFGPEIKALLQQQQQAQQAQPPQEGSV